MTTRISGHNACASAFWRWLCLFSAFPWFPSSREPMKTGATQISATIVTLNEERNIARAIESLRIADEIVVVDSGSTDATRSIAVKLGARVIDEPWRGYVAQKNFAAAAAAHDWILSLDADESVTDELAAEIAAVKAAGARFDAYSFPRLAHYLGRWIHHSGWYPDRKVRL